MKKADQLQEISFIRGQMWRSCDSWPTTVSACEHCEEMAVGGYLCPAHLVIRLGELIGNLDQADHYMNRVKEMKKMEYDWGFGYRG